MFGYLITIGPIEIVSLCLSKSKIIMFQMPLEPTTPFVGIKNRDNQSHSFTVTFLVREPPSQHVIIQIDSQPGHEILSTFSFFGSPLPNSMRKKNKTSLMPEPGYCFCEDIFAPGVTVPWNWKKKTSENVQLPIQQQEKQMKIIVFSKPLFDNHSIWSKNLWNYCIAWTIAYYSGRSVYLLMNFDQKAVIQYRRPHKWRYSCISAAIYMYADSFFSTYFAYNGL